MRLSTAILKGCKIAPTKCKRKYIGENNSACALGAAGLALGLKYVSLPLLNKNFPCLTESFGIEVNMKHWIVNQNDKTNRTREEIAKELKAAGF